MNYWESNTWLVVLCGWLVLLAFSTDQLSAGLAALWLAVYNLVPVGLDNLSAFAFDPLWGFTVNGFIASVIGAYAYSRGKAPLFFLFALVSVAHFIFAVIKASGAKVDINQSFFVTAYTLETLIVLFSMGWRFGGYRVGRNRGDVGRGFYDHRSGH